MYRILKAEGAEGACLISREQLARADFERIAAELSVSPRQARKVGFVAARCAAQIERIETLWNGHETVAEAQPGDWIATNLTVEKEPLRDATGNLNVYVIAAARFPELYHWDHGNTAQGEIYRPRTVVRAIYLPGGFEILAPWGEIQRADAGYLIDNGAEVYGNAKETFEKTYAWV